MSVRRVHVPGLKGRTDWLYFSDNVPTTSGCKSADGQQGLGLREEFDSRSDDDSPRAACALDALVLFFPGDIQTETRFLIGGPYADCVAWSYDRTLALLQDKARRRWANPGVVLVAPTRLVSYRAEYDHIVRRYGTAVRHLAALLDAVGLPADLPLLLVGFSRGVLVLNAVLAEIATVYDDAADSHALAFDWTADGDRAELPEQDAVPRKGEPLTVAELRQHAATIKAFCCRIVAVHFVDGHRFPTNPQLEPGLRRFLQLQRDRGRPVAIVVHGTPRQLHCQRRPHIKSEHDRFMSLLAGLVRPSLAQSAPPALGCAADVAVAHHARGRSVDDAGTGVYVGQRMYLADLPPSLHSHFRCLDEFDL